MNILFHANAPWAPTGYGVQGKHLTKGWQRLGHEVWYSAYYGLHGASLNLGGIHILPPGMDSWGNDVIRGHAQRSKADVIVSLLDIWVLNPEVWGDLPAKWAPWFPIDQVPCPPQVLDNARLADYPLVYTRFAQDVMAAEGVDCHYIPHGIDTSVFYPRENVAEIREHGGMSPDDFLVGMVAANKDNPSRKNMWDQMQAFQRFHDRHPNSMLYIHSYPRSHQGGVDLDGYAQELGIADCVMFPDTYNYIQGLYSDNTMADLYSSFDVLLSATRGEGFCIPLLEAQACGTPVISTNWTAMPELTWYGEAVPVKATFRHQLGGQWAVPDTEAILAALEAAYQQTDDQKAIGAVGGIDRTSAFDWQLLIDNHWKPLLERIVADET